MFKCCAHIPDILPRHVRRTDGLEPVPLERFLPLLFRRAEAQFRADWVLPFAAWNVLFRRRVAQRREMCVA